MKKSLLISTLISATALAVPAFADGINIAEGGTMQIMYTLNMNQDPSYIYGTLTITSAGTLNTNGKITLGETIQNAGTINVADTTSFVIDGLTLGNTGDYDYYILVDGSYDASSVVTIGSSFSNFSLADGISLSDWDVYTDNGYLVIYTEASPVPEPSMFGLFFGLGAIGLVATRRRRR